MLLIDRFGQEFGLSPSARARIAMTASGNVPGVDYTLGGLLDYDTNPAYNPGRNT
jgi:hypothetical protein